MQAQRILKPIELVKKNAEIERLRQELAALNARIEELEKQHPEASTDARKPGASRAAEPTYRSVGRGEDGTSATGTSGSDRTGGCRDDCRRPVSRVGAAAPVDGARSFSCGATDRAAQDQPGTNGPRQCRVRRAA